MKPGFITTILLIVTFLTGCEPRGPKDPQEAAGEYMFQYPKTGEVEVIILNSDLTYQQELYRDLKSYQQRATPVYSNPSIWGNEGNNLILYHWLAFSKSLDPDQRIDPPIMYDRYRPYWFPATAKREATIVYFSENNYIFIRVKNRFGGRASFSTEEGIDTAITYGTLFLAQENQMQLLVEEGGVLRKIRAMLEGNIHNGRKIIHKEYII